MPKLKTRKAARKRLKITKSGKIIRAKVGHRHILESKNKDKKRGMRKNVEIAKSDLARFKRVLGM